MIKSKRDPTSDLFDALRSGKYQVIIHALW